MEEALVSICTPCYNHEKYLEDYFESIIRQTYKRIELIIIDDRSTDDSVEVIKKYLPRLEERLERVFFKVNMQNLGVTKNCNEALKYAKGEYYKSLASDDILAQNAIEEMVKFLEENKDYNICMSNGYEVKDSYRINGSMNGSKIACSTNIKQWLESSKFYEGLLEKNSIFAPGIMMRRDVFKKYGTYDESIYFEDYEYWLRVCRNEKIGYIDKLLVYYRRSENSISNYDTGDKKKKYETILISKLKIQLTYIKKYDVDKETKDRIRKAIFEDDIRISKEKGYNRIALKLYNTGKKMGVDFNYTIVDVLTKL